jgi:hypothetical protein
MRPAELVLDADRPDGARGAARAPVVAAVASIALAPVLGERASGEGTIVSAGSTGIVIDLGAGVVLVARRGAVRLPLSLHVPAVPRAVAGARVRVVDGVLHLASDGRATAIAVGRWFEPRVPILGPAVPTSVDALAAAVTAHGGADPMLDPAASLRLADALASGVGLRAATDALLGCGGGLTPAGDDVLAGALAALAATGAPGVRRLEALVAAVLPLAPTRTTTLSAALLVHAARAEVAEPARAVLRALAGDHALAVAAAARPLLALGHTSGHHLAAGIVIGARAGVPA